MRQVLIICVSFYVFALAQMSFLVYFFPNGQIPNLIVVATVALSIFEKPESWTSFAAALFGGFLIDVFSGGVLGFWALILLLLSFMIKKGLQDYVRISFLQKF